MDFFRRTTHLSEIIEHSENSPVIIFKYSNECGSSARLKKSLEKRIEERKIRSPIYLVTVQVEKILSKKISEWFMVKHESPQVFVVDKGKVKYTAHHSSIDLEVL